MIEVVVAADAEAASVAAAGWIATELTACVDTRGSASLALSGGTTPRGMFDVLAASPIPWPSVHVFQVDERVAPAGSHARNRTTLEQHLLSTRALRDTPAPPMPVETADLGSAADSYARALEQVCGHPPVLDLVHLGLGADGHTASLFSDDPVLDVVDRDVAPAGMHAGFARLTMTFPILQRSRRIVWLVAGAGKAMALRQLLDGRPTPAGRLRRVGDVVFADRAATEGSSS